MDMEENEVIVAARVSIDGDFINSFEFLIFD